MRDSIRRILQAALTAPSGDNCQPFLFQMISENEVKIFHDPVRAKHRLNANSIASCLSFGCVLETICIASGAEGLRPALEWNLQNQNDLKVAWGKISFTPAMPIQDPLLNFISLRKTDRSFYETEPNLSQTFHKILEEENSLELGRLCFAESISSDLLDYLQLADSFCWADPYLMADTLDWIRFSEKEIQNYKDGMPWQTLGINYLDAQMMRQLKKHKRWIPLVGKMAKFISRKVVKKQIQSASALGCISMKEKSPDAIVKAGRLVFRTWLKLNGSGCAVHPLSIGVLPSLALDMDKGWKMSIDPSYFALFKQGPDILRKQFKIPADESPVWLFRTGKPGKSLPSLPTPRRPLEEVLLP